ncbi:MAG TPA: ParA family protein [Gammaproteobacteria bacterium]|nr:ParA family protein [Gammaproteobacteria bacterium]
MKVWSIANQKGGVGKTTTAVSLAGMCVLHGSRTLLIDMDPHGSMTSYFGYDPESVQPSLYDLFQADQIGHGFTRSLIHKTSLAGLDLIPASTAIATLDKQLGTKSGMGLVVINAIRQITEQYEHVFIDCPPMLGVLMVNALAACDHLVIPVQTEFLAMKGLERMLNTIQMIEKAKSIHINYTIVPTMFDRRTRASTDSLEYLREHYTEHLWRSVIPIDTLFRECSSNGLPISHFRVSTRGARAYSSLLEDMIKGKSGNPQVVAV